MKICLPQIAETPMPQFKGGKKTTYSRVMDDGLNRIFQTRLESGASIGLHTHTGSSEILYVLSGTGKAICDGVEERLGPGDCHYCPEGHAHTLMNDGGADLVFFAVVPQHN
ncbi:MAG: cupin domain-containing protein [Clostridiales bacterium]|uniref:cupin domain-containing protein n=1 Tax=Flavonifractor porci TaxID=3133422 RepID=UPI0030A74A64|nr:cupin domain-containing protein [Clostridiales bacterium]